MKAIDVSNWTGEISAEQARCLAAGGVGLVVCGTQVREITRQQIAAAAGAGMRGEAYVILRWPQTADDASTGAQVRAALETIAGLPSGRLWIDCEQYLSLPTPPPARTVEHIHDAAAACDGIACGIYTSRYWWRTVTGDTSAFAHLPLWDARYVAREGEPLPPFEPYGGWTRAVMTQWRADVTLCGLNVDLDEREEVVMAASEYDDLSAKIEQLRTGEGALLRQEGALGAKCDAQGRELRQIIALVADGRIDDARRRLRYEMTAAGEAWPAVTS